jgi:hypothetical protein
MNENEIYKSYQADWNKFAYDVLGVRLDEAQKDILTSVQHNRRVSVRSGTARGKDYVAAVASLCFLYLNYPSKVINTAPTGRQVEAIMMPEISRIWKNAKYPLGGRLLNDGIYFEQNDTWFMMGFKADDKNIERWSGFHSPNLMVVCTEASGLAQVTFDSIEGILQGNSRELLIFNPNVCNGEAYNSTRSPLYKKHKLSCLDAPNVINRIRLDKGEITQEEYKKHYISGQVDYEWIDEKIRKGWALKTGTTLDPTKFDFTWNGENYRPNSLFRVKVLGEFPEEGEDNLIPMTWIEMANERWIEYQQANYRMEDPLRLGVDVAGMGRDNTVFAYRIGNYVKEVKVINLPKTATIHMTIAGMVANELKAMNSLALIDTIGEGAGVYSRLQELKVKGAISCKYSESAKFKKDMTGMRTFANMRAYLYWALRDALDPANGYNLVIPIDDELKQELSEIKYIVRSDGSIIIEPKEEIIKRIGRSTDKADSVANTFYPNEINETKKLTNLFY